MKKIKNKKKQVKRERQRETDEFDSILGKYKQKLLKSIGKEQKGQAFEEIEMSD